MLSLFQGGQTYSPITRIVSEKRREACVTRTQSRSAFSSSGLKSSILRDGGAHELRSRSAIRAWGREYSRENLFIMRSAGYHGRLGDREQPVWRGVDGSTWWWPVNVALSGARATSANSMRQDVRPTSRVNERSRWGAMQWSFCEHQCNLRA
jgi:hypothetical protein